MFANTVDLKHATELQVGMNIVVDFAGMTTVLPVF